jgi:hypothetical protein
MQESKAATRRSTAQQSKQQRESKKWLEKRGETCRESCIGTKQIFVVNIPKAEKKLEE